MKTSIDIINLIEEEDIEFIRLQFADILGNMKNIAVTASQITKILDNKFRIDSDVLLYKRGMEQLDEDLYLYPILDSFKILPWRPQQGKVGKLLCDVCRSDGTPYNMSSRSVLKKVVDEAKELGYTFMIRPECEFFLFHTDENGLPTTITHEKAGYMDVGPVDFGENARREMVLSLEELGFEIESSHHEQAPAQHEIDFKAVDSMAAADSIMDFRFAVRSIAKRFGLYATFMPKPRADVAGSGLHLNIMIFKDGKNVLEGEGPHNIARGFAAGIIKHARGMCLYTNPTVNSYKRLIGGFEAPDKISWCSKGDDTIIKLKKNCDEPCLEMRFPDASANPYLALAVTIASGMEGIKQGYEHKKEYKKGDKSVKLLPRDLREALEATRSDKFITSVIGEDFTKVYMGIKNSEWERYMSTISEWELGNYLYRL